MYFQISAAEYLLMYVWNNAVCTFSMAAAASLLDASIQPDVLDLESTCFRKDFACAVPAKDAVPRPFSDYADFFTHVCRAFQVHDHEGFQSNDSIPKIWFAQYFRSIFLVHVELRRATREYVLGWA